MNATRMLGGAALAAAASLGLAMSAAAAPIMPSFAGAPTGWVTDRYQPAGFADIGAYQGRNNVLGITINSTTDLANRPPGQQTTFYNTQGMKRSISGGPGSVLAADLYIETSWRDSQNGFVRTDMWGTMFDSSNSPVKYAIIGFTNFGGAPRLRVWDNDNGGWQDLATTVNYGAWTSFAIEFTGTSFEFFVDGLFVYSDSTIGASVAFGEVIMQAYNFADPSLGTPTPVTVPYTAHWSNTVAVPEPASIALVGLALFAAAAARRRHR